MAAVASKRASGCSRCTFEEDKDVVDLRCALLQWYDQHQRKLPWRRGSTAKGAPGDVPPLHGPTVNTRAYAVWVSEVMLQQTQVATVIEYYTKWMTTWPTIELLAAAPLERVNEVWAGLGYYSRARRLHEGARHVVSVLDGTIPSTAVELQKLPGIGPYTAAAIASIVFGEVVGVVDGNVIRVLTRLRGITAEANGQAATTKHLWGLADRLVDPARSGDFNQAVMELGATVCNPKKPRCSECPISAQCRGRKQAVGQADADPVAAVVDDTECTLCKYDPRHPPDIESFPFKKGKKKPTEHDFIVLVVETRGTYLLTQRPKEGLLGGMWEFPNESIESTSDADMKRGLARVAAAVKKLAVTALSPKRWLSHGTVEHIFSHRHHTYHVYTAAVPATRSTSTPHPHPQASAEADDPPTRWVSVKEFAEAAVSTNMKKVMKKINGEPKRKNASVSKFFKRVKKEH